jgi:hypothetical protein
MPNNSPENVYSDTESRYLNDPEFHAAVKMLEAAAERHGFTPGELKQIAFKAALNLEERRALAPFVAVKNRIDRKIQAGMDRLVAEAEVAAARLGVIGVTSSAEPPVQISTPEEWRRCFGEHSTPPTTLFDHPVTVIQLRETDIAGYLKDGTPVTYVRTR